MTGSILERKNFELRGFQMQSDSGIERRHLQRFSIRAFAIVQTVSPEVKKLLELNTQDISSGGAFFPMNTPLTTGAKVKIALYLSINALDKPHKVKINADGEVVRATLNGMAVAFGKHYTMSPLSE